MRLLCDEMLHRLGRWLRAAGYDTVIAEGGLSDAALIARCAGERRVLVTKDHRLAQAAASRVPVALVPEGGIDATARSLREQLGIDWQRAPFSRCLVDNAPLAAAEAGAAAAVPPRSRAAGGPLYRCPECARLYWPGSHFRRMKDRLAEWKRG